MPKLHLTNSNIMKTSCPEGRKKVDLFDTRTKGLMLEIRATGGRTFYLRYTDRHGKTRQYRLADVRDVTISQARALADEARNKIARGVDPAEEKAAIKSIPTFRDYAYDCYLPRARINKLSWKCDEGLIRNHLLPRFGKKHLDEIKQQAVIDMINERLDEGAAPGSVNRLVILMRFMYNCAIKNPDLPGVQDNPVAGVRELDENNKREWFLSIAEVERLHKALVGSPNRMLRYIVAFLLVTGARRNEVLHAKWEDIDLEKRMWRIPRPKGGKPRHVQLGDGAVKTLRDVFEFAAELESEYVFPNPKTCKPFVSIFYAWDTVRKKAGLSGVRIHDLRHTFASHLINDGRSLYEVSNILGHKSLETTRRYAHLTSSTLRDAANATRPISDIFEKDRPVAPTAKDKLTVSKVVAWSSTTRRPIRLRVGPAFRGPEVTPKVVKLLPWTNILEGMRTEEQRMADEQAFNEYFDFLESQQPRRSHVH